MNKSTRSRSSSGRQGSRSSTNSRRMTFSRRNKDYQGPYSPYDDNSRGYERADMDRYGRDEQYRDERRYSRPYRDEYDENERMPRRYASFRHQDDFDDENIYGREYLPEQEDYPYYGYEETSRRGGRYPSRPSRRW